MSSRAQEIGLHPVHFKKAPGLPHAGEGPDPAAAAAAFPDFCGGVIEKKLVRKQLFPWNHAAVSQNGENKIFAFSRTVILSSSSIKKKSPFFFLEKFKQSRFLFSRRSSRFFLTPVLPLFYCLLNYPVYVITRCFSLGSAQLGPFTTEPLLTGGPVLQFEKSSRLSREAEDQLKVIPKFCFPDSLNWEPSSHMPRSGQTRQPTKGTQSNRSKSTRDKTLQPYIC